ncbi:hypothetical protein MN116_003780 [Schistosoma mekongi]|uniref:Uncharacterized protein n=1 Tax=Schistosoma mekongi TaxID=38744 RepID=A0AAE1ZFU7_SCHME|nr:hypothetical protein MN116_003780 [Schistosoma mekongi]
MLQVLTIVLISSCTVTFGVTSRQECSSRLRTSMTYCFQQSLWITGTYQISSELKSMRDNCINNLNCRPKAKDCLLSELQSPKFNECPLERTYIKSVDRLIK